MTNSKTREENHADPRPLNFFSKFKYRSSSNAHHECGLRLNLALQEAPDSKKLLNLRRKWDNDEYRDDWASPQIEIVLGDFISNQERSNDELDACVNETIRDGNKWIVCDTDVRDLLVKWKQEKPRPRTDQKRFTFPTPNVDNVDEMKTVSHISRAILYEEKGITLDPLPEIEYSSTQSESSTEPETSTTSLPQDIIHDDSAEILGFVETLHKERISSEIRERNRDFVGQFTETTHIFVSVACKTKMD
ncbi:1428_t:CDS:2 [Acaulospora morrowiae]|uniref:1428_t:CDS:1 n=1 Tax=Acaulospora morrowiae TaxID=94023 RepID=A0A9N9EZZ6_9GLOM|nr:1428_t:CDS:2 [Acaulospora morrowiae]